MQITQMNNVHKVESWSLTFSEPEYGVTGMSTILEYFLFIVSNTYLWLEKESI